MAIPSKVALTEVPMAVMDVSNVVIDSVAVVSDVPTLVPNVEKVVSSEVMDVDTFEAMLSMAALISSALAWMSSAESRSSARSPANPSNVRDSFRPSAAL